MPNHNQVHMIRDPYGSHDVIGQYYTDPLPPLNEDGTTSTMPLRSLSGMRVVDESEHNTLHPLLRSLAFSKRKPSSNTRLNITPRRNYKEELLDNSKKAKETAAAAAIVAANFAGKFGRGFLYTLDDISRMGGKKKTKKTKKTKKRKPTKRKPTKRRTH